MEALLANVRLPEVEPLLVGVKTASSCSLWPEAIVSGRDTPGRVNWELLLEAEEMVTLAPVAFTVKICFEFEPMSTLPKFTDAGVRVS